jgi:trehalose 6-phosphate phosphatase
MPVRGSAVPVVPDLSALSVSLPRTSGAEVPVPSALERLDELLRRAKGRRMVIFLDYDGTLTPIVARPEQAQLDPAMRKTLERLAGHYTVAVISGRDLADVGERVGLDNLLYAGSHGFDIAGQDRAEAPAQAIAALPELDRAETALRKALSDIDGAWVERKRFAVAVHYRLVDDAQVNQAKQTVEHTLERHAALRMGTGKKVCELLPDVEWDKGAAVSWLLKTLGLEGEQTLPLYIGDDTTDEDAFAALRDSGVGIAVLTEPRSTRAHYRLDNVAEVQELLAALASMAESPA